MKSLKTRRLYDIHASKHASNQQFDALSPTFIGEVQALEPAMLKYNMVLWETESRKLPQAPPPSVMQTLPAPENQAPTLSSPQVQPDLFETFPFANMTPMLSGDCPELFPALTDVALLPSEQDQMYGLVVEEFMERMRTSTLGNGGTSLDIRTEL